MKKILCYLAIFAASFVGVATFGGCDTNDGPFEEAGEGIDETREEIKDEVDDATDD